MTPTEFLAMLFQGAFLLLAPVEARGGLLPNGGAEIGIMYWTGVQPVSVDAFTGRFCFQADYKKGVVSVEPWNAMRVTPGEKYIFSAWVRCTDEAGKVSIEIKSTGKPALKTDAVDIPVGKEWTYISAAYIPSPGVELVKPSFLVKGPDGKGGMLFDDLSVNGPQGLKLQDTSDNHFAMLGKDCEQGHDLDDAYQKAGQKIDIVLFDCAELGNQGRPVPEEFVNRAEKASKELREEWWKLCSEREEFWRTHTRARNDNSTLEQFDAPIATFAEKARHLAEDLEEESSVWRSGLIYPKKQLAKDFYKDRFCLAVDVEWTCWGENRLKYPGNNFNAEYEAKAANYLGVDISTLLMCPLQPERAQEFLDAFDRWSQAPYLTWTTDKAFIKTDIVNEEYFNNDEKLDADIQKFLDRLRPQKGFFGAQIDEPLIRDDAKAFALWENEWRDYLSGRAEYLQANGITRPEETVEWKRFKGMQLGSHLRKMYGLFDTKGAFPCVCIMPTYEGDASRAAYTGCCAGLPLAGTDLYRNGSTLEGLHLQLFKNAMAPGKAWLLPGATFSCKTPDNYKRSISNGIVHADGVHMWTSTHFSKYRDARYYWRYGNSRPTLDDRKRFDLYNWYPWGWDVMVERYHFAAKNARVLANRQSLADVALLVSECCKLLEGKSMRYWNRCLAVYNELVRAHSPFDAIFLENMTEEHFKRYRVIIAPNLSALTPGELEKLRAFTAQGGILLTTPDFATKDEWGREAKMANHFGMRFPTDDIDFGFEEYNVAFTRCLRPEHSAMLRSALASGSRMPWRVEGLPDGVEVQFQKNGDGQILLQLLDYGNNGEIAGHRLLNTATREATGLDAFHVHQLVVLP